MISKERLLELLWGYRETYTPGCDGLMVQMLEEPFVKEEELTVTSEGKLAKKYEGEYSYIDSEQTILNIHKKFGGMMFSVPCNGVLLDGVIIMACGYYLNTYYTIGNELPDLEELASCLAIKKDTTFIRKYRYLVHAHGGIQEISLEAKKMDIDLDANYNDDLPHQNLLDFINSKGAGLSILYGAPGTGKTSYLRHLIYTTNKTFAYLDSSMFNCLTDASFIEYLIGHKNMIYILEDCENLLVNSQVRSGKIAGLLNMTDGLLADGLNTKFICTFNTALKDIDPAILRKGRLHTKYEFGLLAADKVQKLGKQLNIDLPNKAMSLCDIFNYGTDNGAKKEKRIGF